VWGCDTFGGGGVNEKDVWFKGKRPLGDLDTEPTVTLQGI